jgi:two-component system OmpR family response regulator
MDKTSVLIVDDDPRIHRMLTRYLAEEGYVVLSAGNGTEMHECLQSEKVNLVLLDLKLPGSHGLQLAGEIKAQYERIGIIILTGSSEVVDMVVGLEVGADDYVAKPFEERELLARIRSVLRRTMAVEDTHDDTLTATFSNYKLDFLAHTLFKDNDDIIELTTHQYKLLSYLVHNANRVLSRDQIMDEIVGKDWSPLDRSVDVLVGKLRSKIEPDATKPSLIKTIRGAGYKFTTAVTFQQ